MFHYISLNDLLDNKLSKSNNFYNFIKPNGEVSTIDFVLIKINNKNLLNEVFSYLIYLGYDFPIYINRNNVKYIQIKYDSKTICQIDEDLKVENYLRDNNLEVLLIYDSKFIRYCELSDIE